MSKLLKTLKRTVVLEGWVNSAGRRALREVFEAYRAMLQEMVEYAVEHNASQATLHRVFYSRFREEYPWLPTRVIKGCYRDAVRRARSFLRLKKKGLAQGDKPVVKNITVTYSDSQDWRLVGGDVELRTHRGWIRLNLRYTRQLVRYLYGGWKLSSELKLKPAGKRILVYLTFRRVFEVSYNPNNVIAVDVNENNVTLAVFRNGRLGDVYRIETNLGRIVIAYSERRKRITGGKSTKDRSVKKALRKLREGERKTDIIYKVARFIEELAYINSAVVVVGNVHKGKRRLVSRAGSNNLRHRIHQWSVSKLVEVLDNKPIHVVEVPEAYSSSRDPFSGEPIKGYAPSVIRVAVRGRRVRVAKVVLRLARLSNGLTLDRDVVGAVNIGLKHLTADGSPVALGSTGPHEVRVKLVNPHQGPTPPTELKVIETN
ncbi:ISC1913-like transposase [Thermogladius calderae 1633]|uniref:ISC1913-like transposase n=1 Tax=Thermogladius calderae (strain DSM 22663 / VKM B-2946 / 1633) TaxID=1184251 RepID=I3TCQ5_THEC1|nr:IS200/IS605 family accessory protein TnpB-related protein [Thermogladius calderae]AFK50543.1 ISC1913-like transposase [Thermogladius calderae 1633]